MLQNISVPKKALALSFAVLQEVTHSASAAPVKCPQSQLVTGYSTWTSLKNDIESSNGGGTFNLCPGSVLDAAENPTTTNDWRWIYITDDNSRSGITIQCGDQNKYHGECTIQGSNHHFAIAKESGEITIKGITFKGSGMSCIYVDSGNVGKPLNVIDCNFIENTDTQKFNKNGGTIDLHSGRDKSITFTECNFGNNLHNSEDGKLINVEEESVVEFNKCTFNDNFGKANLVHVHGGSATFHQCSFIDNLMSGTTMLWADHGGGDITLNDCIVHRNDAWNIIASGNAADINIHKTCFVNNVVHHQAVAYVVGGGYSSNDNFGGENSKCNGFYFYTESECQEFKSNQCQSSLKNDLSPPSTSTSTTSTTTSTTLSSTALKIDDEVTPASTSTLPTSKTITLSTAHSDSTSLATLTSELPHLSTDTPVYAETPVEQIITTNLSTNAIIGIAVGGSVAFVLIASGLITVLILVLKRTRRSTVINVTPATYVPTGIGNKNESGEAAQVYVSDECWQPEPQSFDPEAFPPYNPAFGIKK